MAEYIPLLTLVATIAGGTDALLRVTPPSAPRVDRPLTMHFHAGLSAFGRPPVTTPPGDPGLFRHVRTQPYNRPSEVPAHLRAPRLIPRTAFGRSPVPEFRPQPPTDKAVA